MEEDEWLQDQQNRLSALQAEIFRLNFHIRKFTHPRPSNKGKRPTQKEYKEMKARLSKAESERDELWE